MKSICKKVLPFIKESGNLPRIIYTSNKLNLASLFKDFPEDKEKISSNGRERRLQSNIFRLDAIHKKKQQNDFGIYGIENSVRVIRYIDQKYIDTSGSNNIMHYKVMLPKSNGSGALGEVVSSPIIGKPMIGYTYTFIGIGNFKHAEEAEAALKYIKTKFARTLLGILKVTQDNTSEKWKFVPLQDFTKRSDINWTKSVSDIDKQLYKKYDLSEDEIKFIEMKVQAME